MYSSRLRWAIVNEDRHCGARRRRARIPWSIEVDHGPAWSRTSSMRDVAGLCGNLLEFAGPLLEFAGHCGTPDTARGTLREGGGGGGDRQHHHHGVRIHLLRDDT